MLVQDGFLYLIVTRHKLTVYKAISKILRKYLEFYCLTDSLIYGHIKKKESLLWQSPTGDNVPLSELDCKKFCEESEVGLAECRKFCEPPVAPCVYFHSDTFRSLTWLRAQVFSLRKLSFFSCLVTGFLMYTFATPFQGP
jgi:hypothetical protein